MVDAVFDPAPQPDRQKGSLEADLFKAWHHRMRTPPGASPAWWPDAAPGPVRDSLNDVVGLVELTALHPAASRQRGTDVAAAQTAKRSRPAKSRVAK